MTPTEPVAAARSSLLPVVLRRSVRVVVALCALVPWGLARADKDGLVSALSAKKAVSSSCVTAECHADVKPDPRHKAQGLSCQKCHPNVKQEGEHKGALDELPPEEICALSGCHADNAKLLKESLHKDSTCDGCHGAVHDELVRYSDSMCKGCHGDQVGPFRESVHASGRKPVTCPDCHGNPHDPKKKTDPMSPTSKVLQVGTCAECHDKEYVRAFRKSVHGQGLLKSGLAVAPTCSDCHGAHDVAKIKSEASKLSGKNVIETCGKCHTFIVQRWKGSAHGRKWLAAHPPGKSGDKAEGDKPAPPVAEAESNGNGKGHLPGHEHRPEEGPVCTSCHPGHLTFDPMIYGNHLKMADRCGQCHEEEAESYRETFHGKATRLGLEVAATCAGCHTPHDMLPADDPLSSVNPKHLKETCGACHDPINENFLGFRAHLDPSRPDGDKTVHLIWFFMTALLLGTLGFFALHTILWLQRSIVALRRKELHHESLSEAKQWVRRFRPIHIGIHLTIVITFLLLAATGLPLKFSGLEWAAPIATLFGGPFLTRWIHRIAGIGTFGYAAVFVVYLIREIGLRGRRELLWGWQSMIPSKKDLVDLVGNLRWFLYKGPPPKLDRWAYWEKFDFFAVFWGIPVIGLSGLVLWMPLTVTKYLPGIVINIAYLVHSDEALLATGFIFLFHFFHTHLRPEAFPLDTVIFLGRMPLERFKAERPEEYERLKASGELEKLMAPAPTAHEIRNAYRFGTVALVLGSILGACLLVTGIAAIIH